MKEDKEKHRFLWMPGEKERGHCMKNYEVRPRLNWLTHMQVRNVLAKTAGAAVWDRKEFKASTGIKSRLGGAGALRSSR